MQNVFLWVIIFLSGFFQNRSKSHFFGTKLRISYVVCHIKKLFSDSFVLCDVFLSQSREWNFTGMVALVLMHALGHLNTTCLV